jgi:lipopolysaccharide transport system ATP-binding protein
MKPIIEVDGLSKRYRIGANRATYVTLREVLAEAISAPLRRLGGAARSSEQTIWALKDVSFDVHPGEIVGIIGRNGAGKSTLLKVLSRITEPTQGRVKLYGRLGSLLEVGTGFHPELTGRENIYLNSAILGMGRRETERKFDEIVAFAEVERFLDTPVKRYSSGMYTRLAFAVAAHLEPEILLVDEVLAVGDAAFQQKCIGKMGEVAREGRTVLFVSHNMGAVIQLCTRAIVLAGGTSVMDGDVRSAVSAYLNETRTTHSVTTFPDDPESDVKILSVSVVAPGGEVIGTQPHTDPFDLLIKYRVANWKVGSYLCVDVFNEADTRLLWSSDVSSVGEMSVVRPPGLYEARVRIPGMVLSPGRYCFTAAIVAPRRGLIDVADRAVGIKVTDGGSLLSNFGIRPHAATMIPLAWETTRPGDERRADFNG